MQTGPQCLAAGPCTLHPVCLRGGDGQIEVKRGPTCRGVGTGGGRSRGGLGPRCGRPTSPRSSGTFKSVKRLGFRLEGVGPRGASALSCFTLSCFTLSCFTLSCSTLKCLTLSCTLSRWVALPGRASRDQALLDDPVKQLIVK